MADRTVSPEEMEKLANEIVAKVVQGVHSSLLANALGLSQGSRQSGLGYDCKGTSFTCGEYQCTTSVSCEGDFGCTVKFAGFSLIRSL